VTSDDDEDDEEGGGDDDDDDDDDGDDCSSGIDGNFAPVMIVSVFLISKIGDGDDDDDDDDDNDDDDDDDDKGNSNGSVMRTSAARADEGSMKRPLAFRKATKSTYRILSCWRSWPTTTIGVRVGEKA